MATKVYRGRIVTRPHGEDDDALILFDHAEPLAEYIETDLDLYGRFATVRYWISDTDLARDQLDDNLAKVCAGAVDADYTQHYSEYTGYLWTDQELMVGGHNLMEELESFKGRNLHLEIEYFAADPTEEKP